VKEKKPVKDGKKERNLKSNYSVTHGYLLSSFSMYHFGFYMQSRWQHGDLVPYLIAQRIQSSDAMNSLSTIYAVSVSTGRKYP
jgi:hypothetical protein